MLIPIGGSAITGCAVNQPSTVSPLITGRLHAYRRDPWCRFESNYTADYVTDSRSADGGAMEAWPAEPGIRDGRGIERHAAGGCRLHFHILAFSGLGQDRRPIAADGRASDPAL